MSETVPSVPSEAVERAADVIADAVYGYTTTSSYGRSPERLAQTVLAAAFPLIEAAVAKATAEKIAAEIDSQHIVEQSRYDWKRINYNIGMTEAADIARSFAGPTTGDADERA